MSATSDFPEITTDGIDQTLTVARNVSTRYLAIAVEAVLGLVVLPFNLAHLGQSAYGLWMLTASVTTYFSVLDLGYGGALVKFVAQYRARREVRALNEILSTTFVVFATVGVVTYLVAIAIALYMGQLFHLTPEQVHTGRIVMLIISLSVAVGTAVSVFGAVTNGFQRFDLNNLVGTAASVITAAVNVAVLLAGYGLVELVAATTAVRLLSYVVYRANAYRVFPAMQIRIRWFRRERLREVTSLSVFMLLIDWANKLNYSVDALIIGAFLNTSAVAVWTVGQRLAEVIQRLTNQLNEVLFPTVVDNDTAERVHRLQAILVQGTRLSLATVVPMGGAMILMAAPLVQAWVGPEFAGSVAVLQLLALTVIVRIGTATASTLLKGAGEHRLVAVANIAAAVVNVAVSVAIVAPFGLVGVAAGTLVPVCIASSLVIFPAGCRRVQMTLARGLAEAVWPALWPAAVMAAFVYVTRDLVPVSLIAVAAEIAAACAVYLMVFVAFGISRTERRFYLAKTFHLLQRTPLPVRMSEGA
ncbi:MAG TPA: oligosaccharide flippase family protein [Vicinamibacterales bacterium]|nr:oligosaccharide flippase family protein [Vicinamibacterales bacterium]